MNYSIGDLLYHNETNDYLLVTGITGNKVNLRWLSLGYNIAYHTDDIQKHFIFL